MPENGRTQHQASRRPRPRTTEARHTPAVSPRPGEPGRRDHPPVLLILRDVPLGDQARILTLNKHLLRRLNVALNEGTTPSRIDTHPLRRNIQSIIKPVPILAPLGLPISTLQNVAKMPINHQGILQRIPPSLLRCNISNRYFERLDLPIARSEIRGRLMRAHVRGKQRRLSIIWRPSELVAQGVAILNSLRPRRIHPRLKNLNETIIRQNSELKRHIALPSGPGRASPTRASTPASGSTHQRRSRASALTVQHYQLFHVKQSLATTTAAPMPYPETQPWPRRRKRETLRPITGPHRPDKPGKWHTLPIRITRLQVKDGTP